jgi:chorismate mutase
MNFTPIFNTQKRPILIAGPCSAETEEQVLTTARQLRSLQDLGVAQVDLFRAGIWKPRTRPGAFEGVGVTGLPWLQRVQEETGMKVSTEVATGQHVNECLKYGIDVLWIGARTTVNPFSVQEIADAMSGSDIPVMVKNPVNPDYKLWVGAIERLYKAGLRRISAVHRGFSTYGDSKYRNVPRWQMGIDLMQEFPDLELICDISHICGRRDILAETAQKAYDLNFDGLMVEVHPEPDQAWSDASQQITPARFAEMVGALVQRHSTSEDPDFQERIENFRQQIDEYDEEILNLIAQRMLLVREIGYVKKDKNVAIFQPERWRALAEACRLRAEKGDLSREFISMFLEAIHQEGISQQERIMNDAVDESVLTGDFWKND